jgi:hypothetical protein
MRVLIVRIWLDFYEDDMLPWFYAVYTFNGSYQGVETGLSFKETSKPNKKSSQSLSPHILHRFSILYIFRGIPLVAGARLFSDTSRFASSPGGPQSNHIVHEKRLESPPLMDRLGSVNKRYEAAGGGPGFYTSLCGLI